MSQKVVQCLCETVSCAMTEPDFLKVIYEVQYSWVNTGHYSDFDNFMPYKGHNPYTQATNVTNLISYITYQVVFAMTEPNIIFVAFSF